MLTRSVFGLVIALASVSGALADHRTRSNSAQNVYNPSGAYVGVENGPRASEPTVWGWRYTPQEYGRR
jgi:hypothetical protein